MYVSDREHGVASLLSRGLSKGIRFARRKKAEASIRFSNYSTTHQKKAIERLLEQDQFILIIFDSCRYDYFNEIYNDYFVGELQKVFNTNTYTKQYQRSTWTAKHDITYVAGGPVITDRNFELADLDYRPSEHFENIINVWDMGYKKELGVTPPEAVTKEALQCEAPQMVVHYFQPHAPYIGDVRLRPHTLNTPDDKTGKIKKRKESLLDIYDKIENNQISRENLRKAYKSNLKRVMSAAKPLISETTSKTVITSDHGELLGEDDRYLHGGLPHRILCELPWFIAEGTKGNDREIDVEKTDKKEREIKDQLRDLGYV
jgi:hypothetical protein